MLIVNVYYLSKYFSKKKKVFIWLFYFKTRSLSKVQSVLLTHGDHVVKVADTFKVIATSNNMIAGIGNDSKKMYGLQFHPEVKKIIINSLIKKNYF